MMEYWDAVKLYNYKNSFEEYCNPRRNSPEYFEVLKIQGSNATPLPTKPKPKKNKQQAPASSASTPAVSRASSSASSIAPAPAKKKNERNAGRPKGVMNKKDKVYDDKGVLINSGKYTKDDRFV